MSEAYTTILAPNASMMTGAGTNTIIVGTGVEGATVIDPASDNLKHLEAIICAGEPRGCIRRILITHGHADHFEGAEALRKMLGIYIYAYSRKGVPCADEELPDGVLIPAGDDCLRAIHTPGHRFDHLCFLLEKQRILFAGDLVAGSGTVVIIPPEGDMQAYLQSLQRLQGMDIQEMVPAHGPIITDPQQRLAEYITHRLQREQQVLNVLKQHPEGADIILLVKDIYRDVDEKLHQMASQSVKAHLLKLESEHKVRRLNDTIWQLAH
ncbi:MBL fold metallo-hydrolase [Dictyobacter kobayashii]|uniref:MBL fold metallo-hydrolase n=1 Tax=Dictyobacter kobayashii TaxID=2014872 RepID=A0A402AGC6_9CHLR|nr:MBL fold metallo-hydrolase [Dictyobacter kobayashii]GCE18146.1 MBL fold metallo-hydrolase [Dictyobacter kobayashii]